MSQSSLFYKQNILTLYRTYFENKGIYRIDDIDDEFDFLSSDIYNQSYKINNITKVNDVKINLLKLYKKQINEVVKFIKVDDDRDYDYGLDSFIISLLENVEDTIDISTAENEEQTQEQENEENQESSIEQPVEQPVDQSMLLHRLDKKTKIASINYIPINKFFEYKKFNGNDVLDLNFRVENSERKFIGFIPSNAVSSRDDAYSKQPEVSQPKKLLSEPAEDRKTPYPEYFYDDPSKFTSETVKYNIKDDIHRRYSEYNKGNDGFAISRYLFKHIINNIYVPCTNIDYNSDLDFEKYRDTYTYLNFQINSFVEIFCEDGKLSHVILLNNEQALKIINKIKDTNKLMKYKTLSGFVYYESKPEINKTYPDDYNVTTLKLILILLNSNKVNNLDLIFLLSELLLCSPDLIDKFKIKDSPISYLFGEFSKKDFYDVMIFIKLINDHNIYFEGKTEAYDMSKIDNLIVEIKKNISRCTDQTNIDMYNAVFENKEIIPKFESFFRKFVSLNTDNILKSIHIAKNKIEELWDLTKTAFKFSKEFDKTDC